MPPRERFRATARRRVDVPVSIRAAEEREDRPANLLDLSLTGASLELGEALVPGVVVTLEIRTPMLWDPLRLPGQIAWAHWNTEAGIARVGIRFDHKSSTPLFSLFELLCSQGFE
jgi:PilZ domain